MFPVLKRSVVLVLGRTCRMTQVCVCTSVCCLGWGSFHGCQRDCAWGPCQPGGPAGSAKGGQRPAGQSIQGGDSLPGAGHTGAQTAAGQWREAVNIHIRQFGNCWVRIYGVGDPDSLRSEEDAWHPSSVCLPISCLSIKGKMPQNYPLKKTSHSPSCRRSGASGRHTRTPRVLRGRSLPCFQQPSGRVTRRRGQEQRGPRTGPSSAQCSEPWSESWDRRTSTASACRWGRMVVLALLVTSAEVDVQDTSRS